MYLARNLKWGRRVALWVILKFGAAPAALLLAFMLVAFCFSMFCQNTSTTMMLIPFAVGIIEQAEVEAKQAMESEKAEATAVQFGKALLIGIAWAANVGGTGMSEE